MGYEELQHTADWAVRVWADDLSGLFAESARAMNALSGVKLIGGPRTRAVQRGRAIDVESLLVAFLSELLYQLESEGLGFEDFHVGVTEESGQQSYKADMQGAQFAAVEKPIKAVTYHNMKIERTERGYETEIVFDV